MQKVQEIFTTDTFRKSEEEKRFVTKTACFNSIKLNEKANAQH
jgi:hypothetical protein